MVTSFHTLPWVQYPTIMQSNESKQKHRNYPHHFTKPMLKSIMQFKFIPFIRCIFILHYNIYVWCAMCVSTCFYGRVCRVVSVCKSILWVLILNVCMHAYRARLNIDDNIDFIFCRLLYNLHGRIGDCFNFGTLRMFSQLEWFTVAQAIDFEIDQIKFADFQFGAHQKRFA